jgi:hypothetical protein
MNLIIEVSYRWSVINCLTTEPKYSSTLAQKPAIGHDPEAFAFTSLSQKLLPQDPSQLYP